MKKILMACFALSALLFTGCDKETEEPAVAEYTISVSPETFAIGEEFTITIKGSEPIVDADWTACYNKVGAMGTCVRPEFKGGVAKWTIESNDFGVGEFEIHGATLDQSLHTNTVKFTLTEGRK